MAKKASPRTREGARLSDPPQTLQPDSIDQKLLAELRDDGRATVRSLARRIGVAPATVSVRLQRLQDRGLITGFHAQIDHQLLAFNLCAYVALQVNEVTGLRGALTERFLELPEVVDFAWVTGQHDAIAKVWARDTKHLEAIVVRLDEVGARSQTMVVLGAVHTRPGVILEAPPTTLHEPADGSSADHPDHSGIHGRRGPVSAGQSALVETNDGLDVRLDA
jgi:Lrp/AsnC family leucine-responsive transcriptional regulator